MPTLNPQTIELKLFVIKSLIMIMQQSEKTAKKWVDYSDDSEEQFGSDEDRQKTGQSRTAKQGASSTNTTVDHRSQQFVEQQLARYKQARQNSQEIWILLESDDQTLLDKKIRQLKENQNKDVVNIYMSRDVKGAWDIKVKETIVTAWITDGVDKQKNIKVTVAERNFKNRERGDRPRERGERGDRRGRGGRGGDRGQRRERGGRDRGERGERNHGDGDRRRNRDNNEPKEKKVYVDKVTGQAPNNKVQIEQKVIEEKERHYTRQEAERVGAGLGNFRNKPKVEIAEEEIVIIKPEKKPEQRIQVTKPKEEPKVWLRRQRQELKQDQEDKDKKPVTIEPKQKKVEYRQKPSQSTAEELKVNQPTIEKKKQKKLYVRVDNLTESQKEQLKTKKPQKKSNDLLSQDSN